MCCERAYRVSTGSNMRAGTGCSVSIRECQGNIDDRNNVEMELGLGMPSYQQFIDSGRQCGSTGWNCGLVPIGVLMHSPGHANIVRDGESSVSS